MGHELSYLQVLQAFPLSCHFLLLHLHRCNRWKQGTRETEIRGYETAPCLVCAVEHLSTTDTLIILQLWRKISFLHGCEIKCGSGLGMRLVYILHMCQYTQSVKTCDGTTCVADIMCMLCCVLSVALSITRYTCKSIVFKCCTSIPSTEYTC